MTRRPANRSRIAAIDPPEDPSLYETIAKRDQPRIPFYDHLPSYKGIVHTAEYLNEIEQLNADTCAVECWGSAGDVVFWHHRTAHMAGLNYSEVIRQAVLADFWKPQLDEYRMAAPSEDMWQDWSAAIQNSDGRYSDSFAADQRLTHTLN